ncbi:MAG: hypothetical protein WCO64_07520 [Actinomycetes bacterium]
MSQHLLFALDKVGHDVEVVGEAAGLLAGLVDGAAGGVAGVALDGSEVDVDSVAAGVTVLELPRESLR